VNDFRTMRKKVKILEQLKLFNQLFLLGDFTSELRCADHIIQNFEFTGCAE
jgi:hypothetical protein